MIKEIEILNLYKEGYSDSKIALKSGCCAETIRNWRLKNDFQPNSVIKRNNKLNQIKELAEKGLSDKQIGKILNLAGITIYKYRIKYDINRESLKENKEIPLNNFQKSVLLGIILGDGHLGKRKDMKNVTFKCEHSTIQENYCYDKYLIFKDLNAKIFYSNRKPDKRTGKIYKSIYFTLPANPALNEIYPLCYKNNIKYISEEFLKDFNEISLCYLFMDDGTYNKLSKTISICLNNFSKEDLILLTDFFRVKFNLDFTIQKNNIIYLKRKDFKNFVSLIFPYLKENFYYKIDLKPISVS